MGGVRWLSGWGVVAEWVGHCGWGAVGEARLLSGWGGWDAVTEWVGRGGCVGGAQ